jgi:hypothetical protein
MLRDAIDQDPKGRVWHVNTKHLVAFAQMVADKTRREMSSPTEWEAYLYEQGESKEDQKKADEAAWSEGRIQCAAVRDVRLDEAGDDIRAIDAAWYAYRDSCAAIDDRWDAAKAKREAWGV